MSSSSASNRTAETGKMDGQDKEEQEISQRLGWKASFSFTTKRHLPVLCMGLLAALIAALTLPAIAIIYGQIFRQFADFGGGATSAAVLLRNTSKYCLHLTLFAALNWLANSIYLMLFLLFGELQACSARDRIFQALLRKDMAWYDTRKTGAAAFLPTIQMQIQDLQISVSQPFGEAIQCFIQALASLAVAFYFSWNLTLVIIASVPLVYIVMSYLSTLLVKRAHNQSDKLQAALKYATNAIRNIETVKSFNGELAELQRYNNIITRAANFHKRQANIRSAQIGFMQFISSSIFFQGFWYGSHLILSGDKNAGQVVTTFLSALMAVQGITGFVPQFIVLQKGKGAGARLRSVVSQITRVDTTTETGGGLQPDKFRGDVEFQHVSFSYPSRPERIALCDVSLPITSGQTSFVIGRSGSGKSTLGQLLVRFYQPSSGVIRLDGIPLEQLDARWLRKHITLVEQHSVMFDDTIRGNIALGRRDTGVSTQAIQEAVEFAMLQQMIEGLPDGLNTQLGPKGGNLSGGQKQRMALARAKVRDTPILILDEPTSALDYITRSAILDTIRTWREGKTTIIITHDISQIRQDDFVYVMDHAEIVEKGIRRVLQEEKSSVFQTFVEPHNKNDKAKEVSPGDDMDNIISLYTDSWAASSALSATRQTSSANILGESIQSPFLGPRQSRMWPQSKRHSATNYETGSARLEIPEVLLQLPPTPIPARDISFKDKRTVKRRPLSVASRDSLSKEMATLRPISFSPCSFSNRVAADADADAQSFRRTFNRKLKKRKRSESYLAAGQTKLDDTVRTLSIPRILCSVWPRVEWSARLGLAAGGFCAIMHAAATPAFAYIFSRLLATFYTAGRQRQQAQAYAITILGIGVTDGIATYGFNVLFDLSAQAWANALKSESLRRILMQPREFFDQERNSVPRLSECLGQFAEEARNLPGRFAGVALTVLIMISITVTWSFASCWKLTVVALGCSPVLYAITSIYNAVNSRWERISNEADEDIGQVLHETFVNIRTIRCLVLEEVFHLKYKESTTKALKVGMKRAIYSGSLYGMNYSSTVFVAALLFWWGSYIVSKRQFTPTEIIMSFNILMLSLAHVSWLGNYIPQINVSRDAGSRLMRLARLPQDSHELSGTEQLFSTGDIAFENLTFAYPSRKEHPVLRNVSFEFRRGSCTAIVGPSGSGKSTIASLLLKLYQTDRVAPASDPDLLISGRDIKVLHTHTLRSRIAIVSQSPALFPGTVIENITYGLSPSLQLTKSGKVRAAAQAAGIADFIESLPQGYDTIVGESGTELSGGQAQRIAIARALVRTPDILILDEATSALDTESANIIRDTIQRLVTHSRLEGEDEELPGRLSWKTTGQQRNMTVIIITHAREMMEIAEHIIMLDKGRVVEQGSFEELKRKRGAFARLLRGEGAELPMGT